LVDEAETIVSGNHVHTEAAMSPPNIFVFVPDQLRADCVGAFGNPYVQTPNLDALVARGARFDNAYVQHPVCSPSRASFLTGWYPHVAGHRTLTYLLRPDEPNFLKTFKQAGYRVAWAGARGDTFAPGATEVSVDQYGFAEPPASGGYGVSHAFADDVAARVFYRGRVDRAEDAPDFDEAAIRTAEAFLAHPPEEPWLLFVPILAPHCPFQVEEPWFSMYDRDHLPDPVPPAGPDDGPEPAFHTAIRDRYGLDRVTPEMWREVIATYYGMISRMDAHFGRILAAIERAGAADTTITAFFADHGEYLGDYGLIEKWPSAMSANITRDPLVIAGPRVPPGVIVDDMVEIIDVFPTLLDLAEIPDASHRHYGRTLRPAIAGQGHRTYAFTEGGFTVEEEPQLERPAFPYDLKGEIQHRDTRLVGKAVAVRDKRWTYVERLYEGPELYDRDNDPNEKNNLAGRPEQAAVQTRLRDALIRWLQDTADVIPYQEDPRLPSVALPAPGTGADIG
jgi:arylsulfatase A-like enzyme